MAFYSICRRSKDSFSFENRLTIAFHCRFTTSDSLLSRNRNSTMHLRKETVTINANGYLLSSQFMTMIIDSKHDVKNFNPNYTVPIAHIHPLILLSFRPRLHLFRNREHRVSRQSRGPTSQPNNQIHRLRKKPKTQKNSGKVRLRESCPPKYQRTWKSQSDENLCRCFM